MNAWAANHADLNPARVSDVINGLEKGHKWVRDQKKDYNDARRPFNPGWVSSFWCRRTLKKEPNIGNVITPISQSCMWTISLG